MTHRIKRLEVRAGKGAKPLLMCALVAGDPHVDATLRYMGILAEVGVDIVELIVPFSEPTYHGAVIQRASARAIHEDVGWTEIGDLVREFRERFETPIVVSSYYNRILARGPDLCAMNLAQAGVDGVMITDLPWDEAKSMEDTVRGHGMVTIRSVAPTTSRERFEAIAHGAAGFLLWTGHSGGDVTISEDEFRGQMDYFRQHTPLPIIASMKVSTGEEAGQIGRLADGVLVGSALVWLIEGRGPDTNERLAQFVMDLRAHLDG